MGEPGVLKERVRVVGAEQTRQLQAPATYGLLGVGVGGQIGGQMTYLGGSGRRIS